MAVAKGLTLLRACMEVGPVRPALFLIHAVSNGRDVHVLDSCCFSRMDAQTSQSFQVQALKLKASSWQRVMHPVTRHAQGVDTRELEDV